MDRDLEIVEAAAAESELDELSGLVYVTDSSPGVSRRKAGRGWSYSLPDGSRLTDACEIERIRSLVIPPAWQNVWICPDPEGHIQATGRDARGRKQYIYHPVWRATRDEVKYDRIIPFGERLPEIRSQVDRDLALPNLSRERILAAVIRLLESSLIRVGNDAYARHNDTYGLTTLRNEHAEVRSTGLRLCFRGKSGKTFDVSLRDSRLARLLRRCQELPGQELLKYVDERGEPQPVTSGMVNERIRELAEGPWTAKDFRTWGATLLAFEGLRELDAPTSPTAGKRAAAQVIKSVAGRLNNTAAVCRKSYIHPAVVGSYLDGSLSRFHPEQVDELATRRGTSVREVAAAEWALLVFLRAQQGLRLAA